MLLKIKKYKNKFNKKKHIEHQFLIQKNLTNNKINFKTKCKSNKIINFTINIIINKK